MPRRGAVFEQAARGGPEHDTGDEKEAVPQGDTCRQDHQPETEQHPGGTAALTGTRERSRSTLPTALQPPSELASPDSHGPRAAPEPSPGRMTVEVAYPRRCATVSVSGGAGIREPYSSDAPSSRGPFTSLAPMTMLCLAMCRILTSKHHECRYVRASADAHGHSRTDRPEGSPAYSDLRR
jgi:hypothetical protein